jgi:hypothetical protein
MVFGEVWNFNLGLLFGNILIGIFTVLVIIHLLHVFKVKKILFISPEKMDLLGKLTDSFVGKYKILRTIAVVLVLFLWAGLLVVPQLNLGNTLSVADKTGETSSGSCGQNPSIVTAFTDTLSQSTVVGSTVYYRLNDQYIGSTAPTTKGVADLLISNSTYLDKIQNDVNINCNSNLVTDSLYLWTNGTWTVYSNTGLLSLATGSQNETSVQGAGGSYNWKLHLQGVDKKSTGQIMVIAEFGVPANISSSSLSGGSVVAVPNGYSRQLTNGYAAAWVVPGVTGNAQADYNLGVNTVSGKVLGSGQTVYLTMYSLEPFVETDGTFNTGTAAYDSAGTAKYAGSSTKTFLINTV